MATEWRQLELKIKFLTPAFPGDAEQKGRWRTPPFKALLRQWWRVAYAQKEGYDKVNVAQMREAEGKLFGNAWLEKQSGRDKEADFSKSLVRLRLSNWDAGQQRSWPQIALQEQIVHPELTRPAGGRISPYLYLGYGPLDYEHGLARAPAIAPGEQATLTLAFPADKAELIETALGLMHLYATIGGRSGNGWGSFLIEPRDQELWPDLRALPLRPWRDALGFDWPHAIGKDKGPLIWQTGEYDNWREVMRALAIVRLGVRTQFVFSSAPPHQTPQPRHWLSYPITRHTCNSWGNQLRLPNSLRFKVRPSPKNPGKLVGIIFHMPCIPPPRFSPDEKAILDVWTAVHNLLDELTKENGKRQYTSIKDTDRKERLEPLLHDVHLKRIER